MNLYLLRHGIALEPSEWKGSDSDRPLTKEGVRKMKKAAKGIRKLEIPIDWVLTSPFRRAYDTAMIVAKELKLKKNLKVSRLLTPEGDPKALARHLGLNFRSWEAVMLVGHEPSLSRFISMLISGTPNTDIQLDKGGLANLSAPSLTFGKCADLEWLIPSKILRNLI